MDYCYIKSPIGTLLLYGTVEALFGIDFENEEGPATPKAGWSQSDIPFESTKTQLTEYFAGRRTQFSVPISPQGSSFQRTVWSALQTIPFGETRCYQDIAQMVGCPKGSRAVGGANNRNPIPIIIPCHRVIGKNGSMVGYGGGIGIKRFLLAMESRKLSQPY